MKKYIVGGYVRDRLLGIVPHDKDWVVVGSTPEEMISKGFEQIGKDFPVFIKKHPEHPESVQPTPDEYALARKERKVGVGYKGFEVDFSREVSLEEDLFRRDFTFNAIAMDPVSEEIIDPYNGQRDLELRIIRHVSAHFREDPLRVLRGARFAAKLNFEIHPETMNMMQFIAESGELESLSKDRVWKEIEKAITTRQPWIFFKELKKCGAMKVLFPEFNSIDWDKISQKIKLYHTPSSKLACIFTEMSNSAKKSFYKRYVVPTQLSKYVERLSTFDNWDKEETGESIVQIIDKLIKSDNQSIAIEQCCGFYVSQKVISKDFVNRMIKYKRIYMGVKFESLSENDRQTLKGKQIMEAIRAERIKQINEFIERGNKDE